MAQDQVQAVPSTQQDFESIIKQKDAEIDSLKEKVASMEAEVAQAQKIKTQRGKENEEVQALKIQSEGILTKAKAMIFENTKVIKNQELQIEALGQQNESLKDVVHITKDLLEIRNLEVKQLEAKINCMEEKVKSEKHRQDLLHMKLETMIRHNGELKREYEAQLCLFTALRTKYNEKELAQGVVTDMRQEVAEARSELHKNEAQKSNETAANVSTSESSAREDENTAKVDESQANTVAAISENKTVVEKPANEVVENKTVVEKPANEVVETKTVVEKPANEVVENKTVVEKPANKVAENKTVVEKPADKVVEKKTSEVVENKSYASATKVVGAAVVEENTPKKS